MYIKTFIRKELAEYAVKNLVTWHWTNPHTQESQPQVTIKIDGEEYWLDIYEKTGELISVHSQALMNQEDADSDMADILKRNDYLDLCARIESQIFQLKLASEQSSLLFNVVNNLNQAYLAGAKHA